MIPYGRQTIEEDDVEAVIEALRSDWLTTGPRVALFERALAATTGTVYAAVVNSGTAALHAAYAARGVGPGDEVVVPALTFAATANTVLYLGARPVFADVDAATGLIDPASVATVIGPRTKAIVGVDYAGLPADYDALRAVAHGTEIAIVADAAHSLGAVDNGRPSGSLADASTLSFHPVKHITTGEGGAVVTDQAMIHSQVTAFRSHGITRDPQGIAAEGPWYQAMHVMGFNYRLTDVQCALGLSQLAKLGRFVARRREIAAQYDEAFGEIAGLLLPGRRARAESSWHLYVVRVRDATRRRAFFERLRADGLGVQVHYVPVYRHPYYQSLGYRSGQCPRAEEFYASSVSLPIYPAMTGQEVQRVTDVVRSAADDMLN